jgi:hypothetical protein
LGADALAAGLQARAGALGQLGVQRGVGEVGVEQGSGDGRGHPDPVERERRVAGPS